MRASVRRFLPSVLALTVCFPAVLVLDSAGVQAQDKQAEYVAEMQKAEAAMSRRQFEEALTSFKQASSLRNKASAEAHLGIARAQHSLGVFNKAADSCKDAVKYCGDDQSLLARIRISGDWPDSGCRRSRPTSARQKPHSAPRSLPTAGISFHSSISAWRCCDKVGSARENYAPEFALTTLDEQRVSLEDLKGKIVLLDF